MTQLKLMLMAAIVAFLRIFARPAWVAQGKSGKSGGFGFLPTLCAVCLVGIMTAACGSGDDDWSALHVTAASGNIPKVKRLIDDGADANAKQENGFTPLHYAAADGQTEIATALIKAGANVFARTDKGYTPLDVAVKKHGKDSVIAHILRNAMR